MTRPAYDTCVFDLYGTLADIRTDEGAPEMWRAFSWYLRLSGMAWEAEEARAAYEGLCAQSQAEGEARLRARGVPGPAEADIRFVFRELGKMRGAALSERQVDDLARLFRAQSLRKLRLFPEAREVLERLRRSGCRLILLTNAQSAFTEPELTYLGIRDCFHHIFMSSDWGVKKPSPAFFDLLGRTGADPARSLMIGNDDESDCRGAARAGMDSLYLSTEQSPPLLAPLPDRCRPIPDLRSVLTICLP